MSQTEKPSVYLETSVISYLVARPSRDLIAAARQQLTSIWWQSRNNFHLYVSELVVAEASEGDAERARARLEALRGIKSLSITKDVIELADKLIAQRVPPPTARADALHIAVAAVNGINYLLTWNCKHIANAQMRPRIMNICYDRGHQPPIICTPEELIGGQGDG